MMTIYCDTPEQPKLINLFQAIALNGLSVGSGYALIVFMGGGGLMSFLLACFLGAALTLGALTLAVLWEERREAARETDAAALQARRAAMIAAWDEDLMDEAMEAAQRRAARAITASSRTPSGAWG